MADRHGGAVGAPGRLRQAKEPIMEYNMALTKPWERTGSSPVDRVAELVALCEANDRSFLTGEFGDGMGTTGGAAYPLPVEDVRALIDELTAANETLHRLEDAVRSGTICQCCADNECECLHGAHRLIEGTT